MTKLVDGDLASANERAARNETLLEGQRRALELAVRGAPLGQVLEVLVRTIEAHSPSGALGSISLLDEAGERLVLGAAPSLPREYREACDGIAIGPAAGSCGAAAHARETVVVRDIASDPLWRDIKELALRHQLRACWSKPIFSSRGEVLATFALYHRVEAEPSPRDREVVELLAHIAALVIERDGNARKRAAAEAELQAANEQQMARLGALFHHAPAGIALLRGPEHVFEVANPTYSELVGGRPLLGRPMREAFPELGGQGLIDLLDRARVTGKPYVGRSQRVMIRKRPRSTPVECYFDFVYQPIPGPSGATETILVVAFDVTTLAHARLDAEAALARAQASEQGLKALVDNLPELAWTALPDGSVDHYNRRWREYTGATPEQLRGDGWHRLHDPALLPQVIERWGRSLQTGEPFEMELTLRGADGVARWFRTRISPVRDGAGTIVRWFGTCAAIDTVKAS